MLFTPTMNIVDEVFMEGIPTAVRDMCSAVHYVRTTRHMEMDSIYVVSCVMFVCFFVNQENLIYSFQQNF